MKLKNLFMTLGLASAMAISVGAAVSFGVSKPKKAKADEPNMQRINVFIDTASYWDDANAKTYLNFSTNYTLFNADSDVSTMTIERDNNNITVAVLTEMIDLNSVGNYDNVAARRENPAGGWWTNDIWGSDSNTLNKFKAGNDNTVIISGDSDTNTHVDLFGRWYKVMTYSNKESYASLDGADTTVSFMVAGSDVANPENAPDNTSFYAWYTDATLTQEWTGTVQSDLTLYARYVG